ncbi:hypothetical protein JCM21900_001702 [Sporobolomyces salmonicolor]
MPIDTSARLAALREQLAHHNLTGYLVDSGDAHANEYTAPADDRRAWISGFTGSAGTAVVLKDQALLWTDGRYHQQASQQLSSDWTLFKHGLPQVPSWTEYLTNPSHSGSTFPRGSRLGLDPSLLSISDYQTLAPSLQSNGIELVPIRENLVDVAWDKEGDRPKRPKEEVLVLDEKYAGESAQSKIERIRKELAKDGALGDKGKGKRCWGMVVSQLDEIAWALNLRGSDIPYNPVFFAHLVLPTLSSSKATLFIDLDQVPQKTYDYLMSLDVLVEPYEALGEFCEGLSKVLGQEDCVLLPPRISLSTALSLTLPFSGVIPNHKSPISNLKSIKNATELQGFRDSHIRDGVALVRYFSWLERTLARGERLTEWEGAERLEEFRKQLPLFKGLSFSTISSTGANASVIHYSPSPTESAVIDKDQIYLCDSGAQFYDGTTDVTRTLHYGTPTSEEKRAYTRVLQGHIAIDQLVFPETVSGYQLDAFARAPLWKDGLGYNHGTGHGVGHHGMVHEGPAGLGTRIGYNDVKLSAGLVLSNEPGYYQDGAFGIRIENLVAVVDARTPHQFGGLKYYTMERLTMCPIATNLIEPALLSLDELEWVNKYNAECRTKLEPMLRETGDQEAWEWLKRNTQSLNMV